MVPVMSRVTVFALCALVAIEWRSPAAARAQTASSAASSAITALGRSAAAASTESAIAAAQAPLPGSSAPEWSRLWIVAGGSSSTLRPDCQECEADYPYYHSGGVLGDIGYRVTNQMDVGGEVFWMPFDTAAGHVRATHIDAVAQFRPWSGQGFFVKGGAGMAFIHNFVETLGVESEFSKAFSVVVGAGWAFRPVERLGFQIFGTQHAASVGDIQSASGDVNDVVGNFWSIGAGIVIR
jgi:hypothetical protein